MFDTVSAFNNAGFALLRDNLVSLTGRPVQLVVVLAAHIVVGGLGFPVWLAVARTQRRPRRWTLHAKLTVARDGATVLAG